MIPASWTWAAVEADAMAFLGSDLITGAVIAIATVGLATVVLGAVVRIFRG